MKKINNVTIISPAHMTGCGVSWAPEQRYEDVSHVEVSNGVLSFIDKSGEEHITNWFFYFSTEMVEEEAPLTTPIP